MSSTTPLPSRLIGVTARIPESLASLRGPSDGVVTLPLRLAWSGPSEFDVADPGQRLTLYCVLLDCGQRADLIEHVNAEYLVDEWPRMRRLTSRRLIAVWERLLPELAQA